MRDINVKAHDGIDLAVRDYGGGGPNVLLLHGATRNLEDWGSVLPHLDGVRIVAMDQRFHGHSGGGGASTSDDWVRDIEAVIEQVELSDAFVVGHSLGGANAMLYGLAHPQCPGVLNIDGYDVRQREFYDELSAEQIDAFLEGFASMSASFVMEDEGDDAWRDAQVAMAERMDAAWGVDPQVTQKVLARSFNHTDGRWTRRPPSAFWGPDLADGLSIDALDVLRRVQCPTLVVLCTSDAQAFGPPEVFAARKRGVARHFRSAAEENSAVRVETIDATHGVIHEQPAEIAARILSFVA